MCLTFMLLAPLTFVSSGAYEEVLINSFESPADMAKVEPRNAEVSLTAEDATSGRQALLAYDFVLQYLDSLNGG